MIKIILSLSILVACVISASAQNTVSTSDGQQGKAGLSSVGVQSAPQVAPQPQLTAPMLRDSNNYMYIPPLVEWQAQPTPEGRDWIAAVDPFSPAKVEAFLQRYPNGSHAVTARRIIEDEHTIHQIAASGPGSHFVLPGNSVPGFILDSERKSALAGAERGRTIIDTPLSTFMPHTEFGRIYIFNGLSVIPCGDLSVFLISGAHENIQGDASDPIRLLYSKQYGVIVIGGKGKIFPTHNGVNGDVIFPTVSEGDGGDVKQSTPQEAAPPTSVDEQIRAAASSGNLEKLKALLKSDNHVEWSGYTPLHVAVDRDEIDAAELLLAKGAEVNAKDRSGWTPLHVAALAGHKIIAELLIKKGADVNAKDDSGGTPLYFAAEAGHTDVAELLLANKAEIDAKDSGTTGGTPLSVAAADGHLGVVELLVAKGAEINSRDNNGQTPLHLAVVFKHEDVAELLRHHGGRE